MRSGGIAAGRLALLGAALSARAGGQESPGARDDVGARTAADQRILDVAGEIERRIAELRGLAFTAEVQKQVYTRDQLEEAMSAELAEPENARSLERTGEFLAAVGLLPDGLALPELLGPLLRSQVAGFYDPEDRTLRCISSPLAVVQRLTMVHELYHALQDQHFPLDPYLRGAGERTDAARARQAVVEGDAQHFTMSVYLPANPGEMSGDLAGESPSRLLAFGFEQLLAQSAIPPYFADDLVWPYLAGSEFIAAVHRDGGFGAISRAFAEPPRSTEEILHPEKYLAGDDPPLAVSAVLPRELRDAKYEELVRDTMGEGTIAGVLRHLTGDPVHGMRGSAGWGGDEVLVARGPGGDRLLVWKTLWDSERDAQQFDAAFQRAARRMLAAAAADSGPEVAREEVPAAGVAAVRWWCGPQPQILIARDGRRVHVLRGAALASRDGATLAGWVDELVAAR